MSTATTVNLSRIIFRIVWNVSLPLLLGGAVAMRALATDFFVATNGSNANPGTIGAPFLTLTQAQAAVRSALPSATGPINVWVRGGTYYLGQPLAFGPPDSGTPTAPVLYSAYTNETATLSGAIKLSPSWTTYSGSILAADIGTNLDIDGLFVNGVPQVMARYPNYNAFTTILNGYASDCISSNRAARWSNPATGFVRGLQGSQWGGNSFKITGVDPATGMPNLQWVGDNNRDSSLNSTYRLVENIFEELDTANEWFYNKTTGELYYYPPAGLNLATATVEAATLSELAGFRGAATNNTVKRITLSNFIFTQTHRTLFNSTYEGLLRGDWAVARAGGIFMSNADFITIQNSTFTNLGGNGIFMSAHNRTNIVNNCDFVDIGASGVQVAGLMSATRYPSTWSNQHTDIVDIAAGPLTDDYPMGVVICSNFMHNLGTLEKQSAGVNISEADSIVVSHNTIYTSPRSGINVNCGCFGGHLVEFNDVWDCVRETSDHGPFNSWGRDRYWTYPDGVGGGGTYGTAKRPYALLDCWKPAIIRNNRFQYSTVQTWGIDLDDGSSNYQIYNNVCLNTGFKLRDGFSRHVYNNIIINQCGNLQVTYDMCQDALDHNLIVNGSPWALVSVDASNIAAKQYTIDTNFFWNSGAAVSLPFSGWTNAGYDAHSLTGDPQFSNVAANDFTVNNPRILAAGFNNIPMNQFGTTKPGTPTPPAITIGGGGIATADPEPLMGATITSIYSTDLQGQTGLPDMNGVFFQDVPSGSYADSQGFAIGDVMRTINGAPVTDKYSFWTNYTALAPGSLVKLVIWRNALLTPLTFIKTGGPEQLNQTAGTTFTGSSWFYQANGSCYNGDIEAAMTNGDSFQFMFYGMGIQFLSEMNSDQGNVTVYIDGVSNQTVSCYASARYYQQVVYTNQNLPPGIHTIKAVKADSSYIILDALVILQPAAPAAPTGLTATNASSSQLKLIWMDNATNETAYFVQRSLQDANYWTPLATNLPAGSTSYTDTNLAASTTYDYRVCAIGTGGPSAYASASYSPAPPQITGQPQSVTNYSGRAVSFTVIASSSTTPTYQWQAGTSGNFANLSNSGLIFGATNATLRLTNNFGCNGVQFKVIVGNACGSATSDPATLAVKDISTAKFQWETPVPFDGLNAGQILTNLPGTFFAAASLGAVDKTVTLGNGNSLHFTADGSVATVNGGGTASVAYPAGTGKTTGNANFDAVLNGFSWDGGPKLINLNKLTAGQQYSVQLFALDNRGGEANRLANFQDPNDNLDYSQTFKMGDDVYVVGTFVAGNTSEIILENLPTSNDGNINALVVRTIPLPPTVEITNSAGSLTLQWAGGTLLEATNLAGPWTTNANASPYPVVPANPAKFFRVRRP
jgi:hypothetical protein